MMSKSFGLDISERALRLIQIKKSKDKATVLSSGEIMVPQGVIVNGKIERKDKFVKLVKELINNCQGKKIFTKYVNACLPSPNTFIKLIHLKDVKNNIEEEIINETKKHIPYPLENTYLDWQFVDEKNKGKVLIAVSQKEIVNNYQESLLAAGLMPKALEVEVVAICRSLIGLNQKFADPVMILDLGATRTSISAFQDNAILFSISLSFSSNYLTRQLAEKLQISPAEAEQAKKVCGLNPQKAAGGAKKILEPLINNLAAQIREAKYFYHEHFFKQKNIDSLLLTGGGGGLPYLTEFLSQQCALKAKMADPTVNLTKKNVNIIQGSVQSYATAIGLALRENIT